MIFTLAQARIDRRKKEQATKDQDDQIKFVELETAAIEIKITGVKKLQINNFGRELIHDKSIRACTIVLGYKLNCLQSDFNRPKI